MRRYAGRRTQTQDLTGAQATLYEATNDIPNARKHYELILHPKGMEVAATKGKVVRLSGRVASRPDFRAKSMQNAVVLRASSALQLLKST
jgi:hypothetical protein